MHIGASYLLRALALPGPYRPLGLLTPPRRGEKSPEPRPARPVNRRPRIPRPWNPKPFQTRAKKKALVLRGAIGYSVQGRQVRKANFGWAKMHLLSARSAVSKSSKTCTATILPLLLISCVYQPTCKEKCAGWAPGVGLPPIIGNNSTTTTTGVD